MQKYMTEGTVLTTDVLQRTLEFAHAYGVRVDIDFPEHHEEQACYVTLHSGAGKFSFTIRPLHPNSTGERMLYMYAIRSQRVYKARMIRAVEEFCKEGKIKR